MTGSPRPTAAELAGIAGEVSRLAADLIRASVGRAEIAATKSSPTDVVTRTDLAAETLIRAELEVRCPGSAVIGEEFDDTVGSNGIGWIVDPLDGTVNFSYDLPVVSVSIAATVDGTTVAGAVTDVLREETFTASAGGGARLDGRPITAPAIDDPARALVLTGFSYDAARRAAQAEVLRRVLPATRDIRCMGSAALNLCWVACGRGDAFYERDLKVYDWAAGAVIAAEAGAVVEVPGRAGCPDDRADNRVDDLLLVAAPGIHRSLRELVVGPDPA